MLNNPNMVYPCSLNNGNSEEHEKIKFLVKKIVNIKNWLETPDELINVTNLTGGITNTLLLIENKYIDEKAIVRIFGFGTSKFIDRMNENIVFCELSKSGLGPIFYGLFENGRIEGYVNGCALNPPDMSLYDISLPISKMLAIFHSQKIDQINSNEDVFIWQKIEIFFDIIKSEFLLKIL